MEHMGLTIQGHRRCKRPYKVTFFISIFIQNILRYTKHIATCQISRKTVYRCLPYEAVKYCISACFFAILWGQNHLMDAVDSGNRGEDECRQLKERLHSFMGSMRYFVSGDGSGAVIIIFA